MKSTLGSRWRYLIVVTVFLLLSFIIVGRMLSLQISEQGFLQKEGDKRAIRYGEVVAHRGMMLDRNDEPLAVSTPVISIWGNPKEISNKADKLPELARKLGQSLSALKNKLKANQNKEFVYLKRRMTPSKGNRVLALKVPGIYGIDEYKRYYPTGAVSAHVVGFTNIDDQGQEGLELAYNSWLSGEPGQVRLVKDRLGRLIRSAQSTKSVEAGKSINLSLDLRIQSRAFQVLKKAVNRYKATSGSAVVLDVQTGEVLAMVNLPSYNPNNRYNLNIAATRNRAVTDVFEPGSVVKPLTIAAALQSGKYKPHTPVDTTPGWMRLRSGYYIRDTHNYGHLDVAGVLKKSSNIGVSKITWDIGPEKVWNMFWRSGVGQASGTGFPGERSGSFVNRKKWAPIQSANLAFGYGFSVTTLQAAQMIASIASEGIHRPISLLKLDAPPDGERIMSQKVAKQVTQMMENVIAAGGTGSRAAIPGYSVAGKTGTAHRASKGGYSEDSYIGSFVGFAPASRPRLVVAVVIRSPSKGSYYGGLVAAPVFAQISSDALRLLGVEPDRADVLTQKSVVISSDNNEGGVN